MHRSDNSYSIIFTLLLHRYLHHASPVASSSKHKHLLRINITKFTSVPSTLSPRSNNCVPIRSSLHEKSKIKYSRERNTGKNRACDAYRPTNASIRWFPSPNSGWRAGGPDAAIIPRNDCHYREREGERAGGRTGQRDWPALRLRFCLVPLADKQRLRTSLLCSGRLRPQPASRCNFVASCHSISPLKTAFWNRSVPSFKRPAVKLFER